MGVGINGLGSGEKVTINGEKVKERLDLRKSFSIKKYKSYNANNTPIEEPFLKINDNRYIFVNHGSSWSSENIIHTVKVDLENNDIYIYRVPLSNGDIEDNEAIFAEGFKDNTFYMSNNYSAAKNPLKKYTYNGDYETKGGFTETLITSTNEVIFNFCTGQTNQKKFYMFCQGNKFKIYDMDTNSITEICDIDLNTIRKIFLHENDNSILIITSDYKLNKLNIDTKEMTQIIDFRKKFNLEETSTEHFTDWGFSMYDNKIFCITNRHTTGEVDKWDVFKCIYDLDTEKTTKTEFYAIDNSIVYATIINDKYFIANCNDQQVRLFKKIYE